MGRGRNFILKVDPSTLAPGTVFTTDNPLVRRITPDVPVRFDFGVKLPVRKMQGGEQQVELELGEVIFAPGSAEVRSEYLPVIEQIAAKVVEYRGGEVLISANGDTEALAFDRATAVKNALLQQLPRRHRQGADRQRARRPGRSVVAGGGHGRRRPAAGHGAVRYRQVRGQAAVPADAGQGRRLSRRVGRRRPSPSSATPIRVHPMPTTLALGMRRAKAVYEAFAAKLSPEVRAKVRVESSNDPAAPAGTEQVRGWIMKMKMKLLDYTLISLLAGMAPLAVAQSPTQAADRQDRRHGAIPAVDCTDNGCSSAGRPAVPAAHARRTQAGGQTQARTRPRKRCSPIAASPWPWSNPARPWPKANSRCSWPMAA